MGRHESVGNDGGLSIKDSGTSRDDAEPANGADASALRASAPLIGALDRMYKHSSTLTRPQWSLQPMWRYLAMNRLIDILETSELHFTHLSKLEDQLEGTLTARSHRKLRDWFMEKEGTDQFKAEESVKGYLSLRGQFYVNCWHMNSHESYLMWKAYANRGYAITTTFERLAAALKVFPGAITGGVVQYLDFARDACVIGNAFRLVETKDKPYSDEREFRLVYWNIDPENTNIAHAPDSVRVAIDIKMLVERIVPSPNLKAVDPKVSQLADALGIRIGDSTLVTGPRHAV